MSENQVMTWEEAAALKAREQAVQRASTQESKRFISFKSGIISVDKVPVPGNKLTVIVLCFMSENTWYESKYDPNNPQTPACWSVYDSIESMVPDVSAENPQADTCKTCPKFKWGSDPQGGRGKACKTRLRLALMAAPLDSVVAVETAEVRFATLPVTSGKDFDAFLASCQLQHNRPMFGVFSELSAVPDVKSQFKVILKPLAPVDPAFMLAILERVKQAEKDIRYEYQALEEGAPAKPLK